MRHPIFIITIIALGLAWVVSILWLTFDPDWEPALTSLTLIAAITGLFLDKWLSEKERRKEILQALVHELYINLGVLDSPEYKANGEDLSKLKVYPQLIIVTVGTALSSGVFLNKKDAILFKRLTGWYNKALSFNQRLSITEIYIFSNPKLESIKGMNLGLVTGLTLNDTRKTLKDLVKYTMDNYAKESKKGYDTVLFDKGVE